MTYCEDEDCSDIPAHEHRAGDFWIHVDWKAVARELVITGERPNYLERLIHVLAEALMDESQSHSELTSAGMKRYWARRKERAGKLS